MNFESNCLPYFNTGDSLGGFKKLTVLFNNKGNPAGPAEEIIISLHQKRVITLVTNERRGSV